MNLNKKFLHTLLKIVGPSNRLFNFEDSDYISNTLCMFFIGIHAFRYTMSHGRVLHKFDFIKRYCNRKKHNEFPNRSEKSNQIKRDLRGVKKDLKTSNVNKSSIDYQTASYSEDTSTKSKKKKQRPNYFVAFQVTNDEIHATIKLVQEHILQQNKRLEKCLISRNSLHITLTVLYLKDSLEHSNAMKALNAVYQEYNRSMCEDPLKLEFIGMGHFGNKVLFAKIKQNSAYDRLCDITKSIHIHLEAVGIHTTDTREFNPHLTIAKIDFTNKSLRGITKLPKSLYEKFIDLPFGMNTVQSIQLLSMTGPKTSSGYYSGDELSFSQSEPMLWKKLSSLMSIAEQKKEIRSIISKLTENAFK